MRVDAGDPVDPPPPELTEFAGLVVLADGPEGSNGIALFNTMQIYGVEVTGTVPGGTCQTGKHNFGLRSRSGIADPRSVGPQVTVSAGGDAPPMARQFGTGGEPRVYYTFTQSARLNGTSARVSWPGDPGGLTQAFDAELVQLPEAPTPSADSVLAVAGQPLKLDWTGPAGDMVLVVFRSSTDETLPTVTCAVRDTGTATLPASALALLTPKYDRVHLDRVRFSKVPYVRASDLDYGIFGIGIREKVLALTVQPKRMFVTSATFTGDLKTAGGGTSGLDSADKLCTAAATDAVLGGTWKAWLSDEGTSALDRIADVGPWYLLNGRKVFENKAGFLNDPLGGAVNITETGAAVDTANETNWVWTGSGIDGRTRTGTTCVSWTSSEYTRDGQGGNVSATDYWWSTHSPHPCSAKARLYCIEQ